MTDDSLLVNKYRYEIYWILQGVGRATECNPTSAGTKHTRLQLLVD